jgi:hypothetical protein
MKEHGRPAAHDEARGGGSTPPPPPPWSCRLDAIVWWHRAGPGAAAALPEALTEALRAPRRLPVTLAAVVRYAETPVGPYGELAGSPLLLLDGGRVAGHVPFIAVDSVASADAGRALWALPKVMAAFTWPAGPLGAAAAEATVRHGEGAWSVAVRVHPRRARVPFAVAGRCLQVDEEGRRLAFPVHGVGLAAPARARVAVGGPEAPAWLRDGDHAALVLSRTRVRVGRAAPPQACSSAGSPSMLTALFSAE